MYAPNFAHRDRSCGPRRCSGVAELLSSGALHIVKKFLLVLSVFIVALGCQTTAPKRVSYGDILPEIAAPSALEFRGDVYRVGYSGAPPNQAIVEYYLPGEGPKSWQKMLALRLDTAGEKSLEQVKATQAMIIEGGNRAVRAYQSTNGHGIEFILTMRGRQELNVFRYVDRTNGTVSLQYAEIIPTGQLNKMKDVQAQEFYVTARSNVVWGLEAMSVPHIEKRE